MLKAYQSEKVDPTNDQIKFLRKEMVPQISQISRDLAARRKKRSYLDGTICNPTNIKYLSEVDKENLQSADAENPEATAVGDENPQMEPKIQPTTETQPTKPKTKKVVKRKKP